MQLAASLLHCIHCIGLAGPPEPCEAVPEQAMGARSVGAPTWLAEAVALAWHAPGGVLPPPYQWRRLSLCARAPAQHSGTPARAVSAHARFEAVTEPTRSQAKSP